MTWEAVREARAWLEREDGTVRKDWGGRTHVALVYPNSYYLGMSSLGFQTIYGLFNDYENVVCERAFWQPRKRAADAPISLESQRPLADFDVIAFSVSYELDYLNIARVLRAAGIPLLATDRHEGHPLLVAGGPSVSANPQPLSPFFDCFAIGEGEAILPDFVRVLAEGRESPNNELLRELNSLPGIYVPALYDGSPVRRRWLADFDSTATASVILTPDTELRDMFIIEAARGCGRGCRFCLAGYWFRPFRFRSVDSLVSQAEEGLRRTRRIGLLGAAVSDHPDLDDLVSRLRGMGAEISASSLRISPLSETVVRGLAESGTQTIALAPEAGSERLRRTINKGATEDDIVAAVDMAAKLGMKQVKLYFMIGLPTETDDDIDEMIDLVLTLKRRTERTGCRIALTAEPFVPKAGTPFQWLAMAPEDVLRGRANRSRRALPREGIDVRSESVAWSVVQGALSRGDSRLGTALAGMSGTSLASWRKALEDHGLSLNEYAHREMACDEPLPWSVVDSGVTTAYLADELEKARTGTQSPPCPPKECENCGVC
jgi:radical SAM superfamily enzyme YgiQ (UPF0313 family)